MNRRIDVDERQRIARMVFEAPVADVPQVGRWPVLLETLAIQPATQNLPVPISTGMVPLHNHTLERAQRRRLPLRFLGYAPAFSGTRVYPGANSDWALMNVTEDTLFKAFNNRLPMPKAVKRDLMRVTQAGIDFDAIYVAHEIAPGIVRSGENVPLDLVMPPPPPGFTRRANALGDLTESLWWGVGQFITASLLAVGLMPLGAATGTFAAASYDPVLFGLHIDKARYAQGRPLALWYYLTHWYWPKAAK